MNRDTVIGILLIAGVIIGFGILNSPSQEELEAQKAEADEARAKAVLAETIKQNEADSIARVKADTLGLDTTALFGISMHGKKEVTIGV